MGRPLKIQKSATVDSGFPWVDTYNIGVVGGNTSLTGAQIKTRVKIGSNAEADGYIIRQKGSRKFLVTDGTNTGVCTLSDLADSSLTADTMTVTVLETDSGEIRLARISNKWGIGFDGVQRALSFTDFADSAVGTQAETIKSGTKDLYVEIVQVDNDETWG